MPALDTYEGAPVGYRQRQKGDDAAYDPYAYDPYPQEDDPAEKMPLVSAFALLQSDFTLLEPIAWEAGPRWSLDHLHLSASVILSSAKAHSYN